MLVLKQPGRFLFILVLLMLPSIYGVPLRAANDTASINKKIAEAKSFSSNDPAKSLGLFKETASLSTAVGYREGLIISKRGQAKAWFGLGEPVRALSLLKNAKKQAAEGRFSGLEADVRLMMIRIYLGTRNLPMAGSELDTVKVHIFSNADTAQMINWYSLKSRWMDARRDVAAAMQYADSARALADRFNDAGKIAVVEYTIGGIFFGKGNYSKARDYFMRAAEYYESVNNPALLLTLYTNVSATYQGEQKYDSAMRYLDKQAGIQLQLGSKIGMLTTGRNKAQLLVDMGEFEKAMQQTGANLKMARQFEADSTHDLYWMGIVYRGMDRYDRAAFYIQRAYDLALAGKNWGRGAFYAQALYQTYYWKDRFEPALEWYQRFRQFNDSVNSAKQREQISFYTDRFEAAEKEKQIIRLKSESEIDRLKRNRLIGILSTILLIGGMLIVFLVNRNRRNRKMYDKEKSLADAQQRESELKLELLEKDLDMKKQELASGMLQIAKKNDFLNGLQAEIKERIAPGDPAVKRIQRRIQEEISAEEEWDSFISSFRDVHPSYMKKLSDVSKGLSKSETRLACLLKINLSSKEIANMLNISGEGIKKARYRLRKKLGLETDTDLHAYLLGLE